MFLSNYYKSQLYLKSSKAMFANLTKNRINPKSYSTFLESYRCCTLTATYFPFFSLALWTWPIEAEEIGSLEKLSKKSSILVPVYSSKVILTLSQLLVGQSLVNVPIMSRYSPGTITSRVAINCPSFRYNPPFLRRAFLRYVAASVFFYSIVFSC